jgi:hypothetical protein
MFKYNTRKHIITYVCHSLEINLKKNKKILIPTFNDIFRKKIKSRFDDILNQLKKYVLWKESITKLQDIFNKKFDKNKILSDIKDLNDFSKPLKIILKSSTINDKNKIIEFSLEILNEIKTPRDYLLRIFNFLNLIIKFQKKIEEQNKILFIEIFKLFIEEIKNKDFYEDMYEKIYRFINLKDLQKHSNYEIKSIQDQRKNLLTLNNSLIYKNEIKQDENNSKNFDIFYIVY